MTTDAATQLAILADALTEIVDLATADKESGAAGEVLARAGDIAARSAGGRRDLWALAAVGGCRRDAG